MALSIFDEKQKVPTESMLIDVLDQKYFLWQDLINKVSHKFSQTKKEWKYFSKNSGWGLLISLRKKTLFYLYPQLKKFTLVLFLEDGEIDRIKLIDWPPQLAQRINNLNDADGNASLMIEVESEENISGIKKVLELKLEK
ncbi:MAG: DUF3788 family protein [Candidatus Cyclobacteriaceae bacterium M3_2C_046]